MFVHSWLRGQPFCDRYCSLEENKVKLSIVLAIVKGIQADWASRIITI